MELAQLSSKVREDGFAQSGVAFTEQLNQVLEAFLL
jgi:hypothetical protein